MSSAPQKAFITGASVGIGKALAIELHRKGYSVFLVARRGDLLEEICAELNALRQHSAHYAVLDLLNASELKKAESLIASGDFSLLVNNVGRGSFGHFETLSRDDEEALVFLNVIVPLRLTHAGIPAFKARGGGGIMFVSSIAAFQPLPYMSTYAATKSFNYIQAMALHAELKRYNIRVLVICPGPTATEFGGVARVPGTVTGIARDDPNDVARRSVSAFLNGDSCVVPGIRAKCLALLSKILPPSFSTWLLERSLGKVL